MRLDLRNPAWLGVLLAFAALVVAIITWQQGRINYTIAFTDDAEYSSFRRGSPFSVTIDNDVVELDRLSTVRLKFWNAGNQTIDQGVLNRLLIVQVPSGRILEMQVISHNMATPPVVRRCSQRSCTIETERLLPNMGAEVVLLVQGAESRGGASVAAETSSIVGFRENLNFGRWPDFTFWGLIIIPGLLLARDLFSLWVDRKAIARGEEPSLSSHWINRLAESGKPIGSKLANAYIGFVALAALLFAPCLFLYVAFFEPKPPF